MKLKLILLAFCLTAVRAFAFEGTVKQVIKNMNGTGTDATLVWYLSPGKCRIDMTMTINNNTTTTALLVDPSSGMLRTYDLHPTGQKYYLQVTAASVSGDVALISVNPTQESKQIQGYKCEKWVVVTSKGTYNVWITRDIDMDWSAYQPFFKSSTEILALIQQGVKGFPMMTEQVGSSANASSVESVAAQTMPATTFVIPSDYTLFSSTPFSSTPAKGK